MITCVVFCYLYLLHQPLDGSKSVVGMLLSVPGDLSYNLFRLWLLSELQVQEVCQKLFMKFHKLLEFFGRTYWNSVEDELSKLIGIKCRPCFIATKITLKHFLRILLGIKQ